MRALLQADVFIKIYGCFDNFTIKLRIIEAYYHKSPSSIFETQNGKRPKMPVYYNIGSDLKIVYIICAGLVTAQELFEVVELSSLDFRRETGMGTVIDMMASELDFDLPDMYRSISYLNELPDQGPELERQILVTPSKSLYLLVDAIYSISTKNTLELKVVSTLQDAILSLRLSDQQQEAMQFFEGNKNSIRHA